ncbi:SDR family NAD(P)-dependent oxidoreductase [Candidatus Poriferisodalis sp.]|uniref:SDR family NAD(P)-dependent oxidoreductase n=1 Tax=Candidatus Poriferisodalis sp. TaxID=3101277 RepID=UPI003C6F10F0
MTSTDYENPYRPVPIRMFNRLGTAGLHFGLSDRLEVGALREAAQHKTGLTDFGDDGHLRALEVLVTSINDEARLTPTGRQIQKSRLVGALVHRLRIEDLLKRHPEIDDIDLGTIILVTGLQRTGTTLLQRLLNSHPEIRGISGAEALVPVSTHNETERAQRARRWRAVLAEKTISYLAPEFMAIHPVGHDQAEEDVLLLDLNFMSQSAEAIMCVPSYSRWLEEQDHTQTYEYFRRVLKVLSWQRPGSAWVLKTPHHMEYLDVFGKVFDGATIVQTHRDPRVTLASFCSMVAHGRGIFSDWVNPTEIGQHWCHKTHRMVQLAMQTRAESPAGQFVDVSYYDLTNDPIAEVRRICGLAGIGFDDEAEREAVQYMAANPQHRFGKHAYKLSDFGLSEQIVDEAFSCYRETYAIPFEEASSQPSSANHQSTGEAPSGMTQEKRKFPGSAIVNAMSAALRDLRDSKNPDLSPVPDDVRIDGKTCLVTGANSGVGRAAAIDLARRGGNMILACRPGHAGICDEIKRQSGSETVELVEVDLADLRSVHRFCDQLHERGTRLDIAVMNAGLLSRRSRQTPQGYEVMFAVNFLAKRVMIDRWLQDGVMRPSSQSGEAPRIVFVSSESHRSCDPIDFDRFGAYTEHGMTESLQQYGQSKLALCTFATELSRRLNQGEGIDVAVHALCPGGVATGIARESPTLLKAIINPVLRLFFQSPEEAIGPVVYLCCAEEAGSSTGMYLHMMHRKQVSPPASDPENGTKLWDASEALVAKSSELR